MTDILPWDVSLTSSDDSDEDDNKVSTAEYIDQFNFQENLKVTGEVKTVGYYPANLQKHVCFKNIIDKFFEGEELIWKRNVDSIFPLTHSFELSYKMPVNVNTTKRMSIISQLSWQDPKNKIPDVKKSLLSIAEAFACHGKNQDQIYQYYVKLDSRRCRSNAKPVYDDYHTLYTRNFVCVSKKNPIMKFSKDTEKKQSLSKKDSLIYAYTLCCVYRPILPYAHSKEKRGSLHDDTMNAYEPKRERSPLHFDDLIDILQLTTIQRAFHVTSALHRKIEEETFPKIQKDQPPNKNDDLLLQDLSDQLYHLDHNNVLYYNQVDFVGLTEEEYKEWRQNEISKLNTLIFKLSLTNVENSCYRNLHKLNNYETYKELVEKFFKLDILADVNETTINNKIFSPASKTLLKEFSLRYGIKEWYQQIVILKCMVDWLNVRFCDWYLFYLKDEFIGTMESLANNYKYLVVEEKSMIKEMLNCLHMHVEYGFVKLYSLYYLITTDYEKCMSSKQNVFTHKGVQYLLTLLQMVIEEKKRYYIWDQDECPCIRKIVQNYFMTCAVNTYSTIYETSLSDDCSVESIQTIIDGLGKAMNVFKDIKKNVQDLVRLCDKMNTIVARSMYLEFMKHIKTVVFSNMNDPEISSPLNEKLVGSAFCLQLLDKDWNAYIKPEDQKWRYYFLHVLRSTLDSIKTYIGNDIQSIISIDPYVAFQIAGFSDTPRRTSFGLTSQIHLGKNVLSPFTPVETIRGKLRDKNPKLTVERCLSNSNRDISYRDSCKTSGPDRGLYKAALNKDSFEKKIYNRDVDNNFTGDRKVDNNNIDDGDVDNNNISDKDVDNNDIYDRVNDNNVTGDRDGDSNDIDDKDVDNNDIDDKDVKNNDISDRYVSREGACNSDVETSDVCSSNNKQVGCVDSLDVISDLLEELIVIVSLENCNKPDTRFKSAINVIKDDVKMRGPSHILSKQQQQILDSTSLPKYLFDNAYSSNQEIIGSNDSINKSSRSSTSSDVFSSAKSTESCVPLNHGVKEVNHQAQSTLQRKAKSMENLTNNNKRTQCMGNIERKLKKKKDAFFSAENLLSENASSSLQVNNGVVPVTSSLIDLFTHLVRLISFADIVCSLLSNKDECQDYVTIKSDVSTRLEEIIVKVLNKYSTMLFALDICGVDELKEVLPLLRNHEEQNTANRFLERMETFRSDRCRHMYKNNASEDGTSCSLLKRLLNYPGQCEVITKEMCFRINDIYSLNEVLPNLHQKILNFDSDNEFATVGHDNQLNNVLHDQIYLMSLRVILIYEKSFSGIFEQFSKGKSVLNQFKLHLEYLNEQVRFLRGYLYEECSHKVLMNLWNHIIESMKMMLNNMSYRQENPREKAGELQQLLPMCLNVLTERAMQSKDFEQAANSLDFRLNLYKRKDMNYIGSIFNAVNNECDEIVESSGSCPRCLNELLYLLFETLKKKNGDIFTGHQLKLVLIGFDWLHELCQCINTYKSCEATQEENSVNKTVKFVGSFLLQNRYIQYNGISRSAYESDRRKPGVLIEPRLPTKHMSKAFLEYPDLTVNLTDSEENSIDSIEDDDSYDDFKVNRLASYIFTRSCASIQTLGTVYNLIREESMKTNGKQLGEKLRSDILKDIDLIFNFEEIEHGRRTQRKSKHRRCIPFCSCGSSL